MITRGNQNTPIVAKLQMLLLVQFSLCVHHTAHKKVSKELYKDTTSCIVSSYKKMNRALDHFRAHTG